MTPIHTAVVIGGGTAGCTVAATLASRGIRVDLLESGSVASHQEDRDFFRVLHSPGTVSTRIVSTTAEVASRPYTQASVLGGGSAVNAMVSLSGDAADYDEWANHLDCPGWSWGDVQPVFDDLAMPKYLADESEIGTFGRIFLAAVDAAERAPLAWQSRRVSAATRLTAAINVTNLVQVRTSHTAKRLLVDGERVTGVELTDGGSIGADAVVLCAGALATPTLLFGLGDVLGATPRAHVGMNLQDHPAVMFSCEAVMAGTDSFAVPAIATLRGADGGSVGQLMAYNHVGDGTARVGIGVSLLDVRSRGRVDSSNVVSFDMLSDQRDAVAMRTVLRWALAQVESPMLAEIGTWAADDAGTLCADLSAASDDDVDAWLRRSVGFQSHASGTCRMAATPSSGAVDTSGAVHGVPGVWVADASVFPRIPRANTNLPVMMVASRIARSIAGST